MIELVSEDVRSAIHRLTTTDRPAAIAPHSFGGGVVALPDLRRGYVQEFDADQLADWAASRNAVVQSLVRAGLRVPRRRDRDGRTGHR